MTDVAVETPPDCLTTYITGNDAFFVRHHWPTKAPDPEDWALVVDGEVLRPLRLSLAELKQLPSTTVTCVLECAGNGRSLYEPDVPGLPWGLGAVGNARWTGVRVRDLLEKAGVKAGVKHLHSAGTDDPRIRVLRRAGHRESRALRGRRRDMGGRPLDPEHDAYSWRLWSFRWTPGEPAGHGSMLGRPTAAAASSRARPSGTPAAFSTRMAFGGNRRLSIDLLPLLVRGERAGAGS